MEGRKERGMAGALRGGRGRQELGGAGSRRFLPPSTGRQGRAGKQRTAGRHSPQVPPGSVPHRARQAAGMGKREHSAVRASPCPGTLSRID